MNGRRVVVTGAAGGIGRAVLDAALLQGAHVFAVDLPGHELDALAMTLPAGSSALGLDLRDTRRFPELCVTAASVMGGLDSLVHAAGVLLRRELEDVTEADWDLQHDVNLKATFFLCREVARTMRAAGTHGSLVTFASQSWWTGGFGGSVVYAASKGGVVSMTRGLARSFAADNIRVNSVAPGFVDTAMMRDGLTDSDLTSLVGGVPLGRLADPAEVAAAALFLASDASSYMTGTTLNVSGGQLNY
jgi:NAD(P)-dependent dehydrogenase (short-subunit alcohol dehydrogenase family)